MIKQQNRIGLDIRGNCYHAYAIVQGIKNRCRKIDRHMIEVGYFNLDHDKKEIISHAQNLIKSEMKTVTKVCSLTLQFTERGEGMESFLMFDKRTISMPLEV